LLSDVLPCLINRDTTTTHMTFSDAARTGSAIAATKSMIFYLLSTLLLERFFVIPLLFVYARFEGSYIWCFLIALYSLSLYIH
jgi:hypothetical protein